MQWYSYLCLQLLPFAVSQVLPPGLPNCAVSYITLLRHFHIQTHLVKYKCASLLTLPDVSSCSDNLEKAVPCICQKSDLLTTAAHCAMSACPLSVITGMFLVIILLLLSVCFARSLYLIVASNPLP
jgi:hypothetical protein